MNNLLIYAFQTSVVFTLLFLPYFFMRHDTFFIRNRIYLLASVLISLVLPFLKFEVPHEDSLSKVILQEITIYPGMSKVAQEVSFMNVSGWIFLIISILFFMQLVLSITKIISMILKNPKEKNHNETIVWLDSGADFSFFRYIFLAKEKYHNYILEHERVHVKRKHSFDILLFGLFRCFQWFNPFVWMAINEIKAQHEYEADELTARKNKNEYQALLLSSVFGVRRVSMTNSFNCLTIKKRFNMMNKKRSPKKAAAKFLIALPFILLSLGIFAMNSSVLKTNFQKFKGEKGKTGEEKDVVYPEFKGGMDAMIRYLSENIVYPETAVKDSISGNVYISFIVAKSGKIKDAKVLRGVSAELDAEALRVIKSMPEWTPGTKGGKKVDMEMTLPISFKL